MPTPTLPLPCSTTSLSLWTVRPPAKVEVAVVEEATRYGAEIEEVALMIAGVMVP